MSSFWLVLAGLAVFGGAGVRRLLRARAGRQPFLLDDEAIRQIEGEGFLAVEEPGEPLDMGEIRDAEEDFWRSEAWEDPEEF
jgi:hypothetical protein